MFLDTLKGLVLCIRLQRLAPKKGGVFFDVEHATKNSDAHYDIALLLLVAIGGVEWLLVIVEER
jgi:hypothetical protein